MDSGSRHGERHPRVLSLQFVQEPHHVAVLFLPWLVAAADNLAVWYSMLARGARTSFNRLSGVLLRIVSAAFALAFLALYAWLLFGTSPG